MIFRAAKLSLLAGIALLNTLIVFNNLTDFDPNYQFVRHVLMMDTTLNDRNAVWRALYLPAVHLAFYLCIIAWEMAAAILLWWGVARLLGALRRPAAEFNAAKCVPAIALTLSLLLWLVAFLAVGGEWFLMWQSHAWNGQEAAFRNFAATGLVLLMLLQPETDAQP